VNDKREIFGWTMYDWANSAFSTTVVTTFLGPYLLALAEEQGGVNLFGFVVEPAAFFPAVVSISVILQVILLPILGAVADYTRLKKRLMMLFAYSGAVATIALFFVTGELVTLGGLLFIGANLSFGAAVVFYNAFLPEIASPDRRDAVSSRGFAFGYLGGGLLLLLNLVLFNFMEDSTLAVRLSLASAGIWWLAFTAIFPQRRLKQRQPARQLPAGQSYLTHSVRQLLATLRELIRKYPRTLHYLIGIHLVRGRRTGNFCQHPGLTGFDDSIRRFWWSISLQLHRPAHRRKGSDHDNPCYLVNHRNFRLCLSL
jgi:UMF1 family MFS transporter